MPTLSSIIAPNNIVTSENEVTLTNKTIDSPVITVNGQSGNPRQPLVFDDNGSVTFGNGDSFSIPAGGTAARPAAPETGELRYNTDTGGLEQYDGTSWVSVVPDDIDLNTLSINGTQLVDSSGNIDTSSVSINGAEVIDSSRNLTNIGTIKGLNYPSGDGTEGQVLTTDGSGNVSFNDIPAAGAELVATGAIPGAGTPVVLRSDGTVEAVGIKVINEDVGTKTVFYSDFVYKTSATYDSAAGKVVIAYSRSGQGYAVVGTVSGGTISFGSPALFGQTGDYISATYDSAAGKVVIAYSDDDEYGYAVVGTVSGDSISFGTSTVFTSGGVLDETAFISATYDSAAGKVVIGYTDLDNDYGKAAVGTVSGDNINFGNSVTFDSQDAYSVSTTYDSSSGKVVIFYANSTIGELKAVVGTVSGDSISFGSKITVFNGRPNYLYAIYDSSAGKVVITYANIDNGYAGTAIVGTVSGDSISFGSPTVYTSGLNRNSATYHSAAGKVVIAYNTQDNSEYGMVIAGTVSGDNISFGSPLFFESSYTDSIRATYDSAAGKAVIAYTTAADGTAIPYSPEFNATNADGDFIGFAQDTASDTETVLVATNQQIDTNQTSLTPKATYYIDFDGTLTTSDTGYPVAGFALDNNTIRTGG